LTDVILRAIFNLPIVAGWSSLVARQAHKGFKRFSETRKQPQATSGCYDATFTYVSRSCKF
jgi:hypothetical protein